ncbi:unnamed protein product [Citrullus colocynthis]|uniref:RNase H type-1 domain-containing protein n=1 Tax=Citrullus colocynthis TaxID=252529 RepID=A0ABP0XT99_9ROSI
MAMCFAGGSSLKLFSFPASLTYVAFLDSFRASLELSVDYWDELLIFSLTRIGRSHPFFCRMCGINGILLSMATLFLMACFFFTKFISLPSKDGEPIESGVLVFASGRFLEGVIRWRLGLAIENLETLAVIKALIDFIDRVSDCSYLPLIVESDCIDLKHAFVMSSMICLNDIT